MPEKKKREFNTFQKFLRSKLFLVFLFIFGLLILAYPLISERYYRIEQNRDTEAYQESVEKLTPENRDEILEMAHRYNEGLYLSQGGTIDGETMMYIEESLQQNAIPEFFLAQEMIGIVEIPKIDTDMPIYVGTSDRVLERGAGYMPITSLPVGGVNTHSVITAHRGLPQLRLFRDLDELEQGDLFLIKVLHETLAYEVDQKRVIEPTDFSQLSIVEGEDYCTLLTCHPYMINSHRLIVRGHRVDYTEEVEEKAVVQQKENRLKIFFVKYKEYFIGVGIFIVLFLVLRIRERQLKKRRGREQQE